MNVLILGLNYAPEPVGIGPYTAGMAEGLAEAGHDVTVICAKPFYPHWQVAAEFQGVRARTSVENGVRLVRVPTYVPSAPTGARRILHHGSFAARAFPALLAEAKQKRPDVVIAIAPSILSVVVARVIARLSGVKVWLHIQDFEVDAAIATKLLPEGGVLTKAARALETWALGADRVSTISPQMCAQLSGRGVAQERIVEFRNWSTLEIGLNPADAQSYRQEWDISRPHIALYSGSIANKQGIDVIIDAARRLQHRQDLIFVICGEGPERARLIELAKGLENIQFRPLQPYGRLGELLSLASVHLLPQIAGAADLLLPSKLANMLASGRPILATAVSGTGIAMEVEHCGLLVPPGDAHAFASAIERLLDNTALREELGAQGKTRAHEHWSQPQILARFERQLCELAA